MIYPDFSSYLDDNLPGYKEERADTKKVINKILWANNKHSQFSEAIAISVSYLRDCLNTTQSTFHKINSKYGFYQVGNYKKGKYARAYYPNPIITELTVGYALDKKDAILRIVDDSRDKVLRQAPEYFEFDGIAIPFGVQVDVEALLDFIKKTDNQFHLEQAYKFYRLCRTTYYSYGIIPQDYSKIPNGRLVGRGLSLQRAPKELRKALLNGKWDYDFSNCHTSILAQQDGHYPTLQYYVDNTKEVRSQLSIDLDITLDNIKVCLLAAFYGAKTSTWEENAIPQLIGSEKAQAFFQHPLIKAMLEEATEAGQALLERYGHPEGKTFAQAVAHQAQFVESEILKVVCKNAAPEVLIFDGWVGPDVDKNRIENIIFEETGYKVSIKKEVIQYGL